MRSALKTDHLLGSELRLLIRRSARLEARLYRYSATELAARFGEPPVPEDAVRLQL